MRVIRNMSSPPRHQATATPVKLASGILVVADLRAFFSHEDPWSALLAVLRLERGDRDAREALRDHVESATRDLNLSGCAIVSLPEDSQESRDLEDVTLALILLSKSSEIVWVARKTPILDRSTLARRLATRDARFQGGRT